MFLQDIVPEISDKPDPDSTGSTYHSSLQIQTTVLSMVLYNEGYDTWCLLQELLIWYPSILVKSLQTIWLYLLSGLFNTL